jgi:hypothetical protein
MKILKTMAIIAGLIGAYSADAQFQKGAILLGPDVGFNIDLKDKGDPDDYKTPYFFSINIVGGYFLNAKNEIGVNIGTNRDRFFSDGVEITGTGFNAGLYWRTYKALGSNLYFSWSTGFSYGTNKYTIDDPAGPVPDDKFQTIRIFGRPSLAYMLNPKIGLRINVGDVSLRFDKGTEDEHWDKDFGFNLSPGFVDFGVFMLLNGTGTTE